MEKIVVGIDGSEASKNALRWAVEDARVRGAEVIALHAYEEPMPALDAGPATPLDLPGLVTEFYEGALKFVTDVVNEVVGNAVTVGAAHCLAGDTEVDEHLRAHVFPDVHRRRQSPAFRRTAGELRVLDVLRTDAEDDPLAVEVPEAGTAAEYPIVDLERMVRAREFRHEAAIRAFQVDTDEIHRRRADELRHEEVARPIVELLRLRDLLQQAVAHDRNAIAERHGLDLVVRDVDRGDIELALEPRDLGTHLDPQLRVEVGERLVHKERTGLTHDRSSHRHALTLAPGQRSRLLREHRVEPERLRGTVHPLAAAVLLHAAELQAKGHVVERAHVRVE